MQFQYKQIKNLFLQQSYLDSWKDYERSLEKPRFPRWDYVILTASNEMQADCYMEQIRYRLENDLLPATTHYAVLPDPDGKRVGSGGATFNVLKYISEQEDCQDRESIFANRRILVIHSGGDSKRIPQYSAIGKLFSPVPRLLPDGRSSTLFDEFIIGMSGVPGRMKEGMLVLSGDVLLLFNALQIDTMFHGAAAISMKEHVSTGKNHGVFLNDGQDNVAQFLHKQTEEHLRQVGAVNSRDAVDLDTGAVLMDVDLLEALFSLIGEKGKVIPEKFNQFVSEEARISFYGDFLYPLAKESTLEQYYKEAPEGVMNQTLLDCRTAIWEKLHEFSLKLICLSPAEFIHFGTTRELKRLVTQEIQDYAFLSWEKQVMCLTAKQNSGFAANKVYVDEQAVVGEDSYLENCGIYGASVIGKGSIVSNFSMRDVELPENTVWHKLALKNGKHVMRVYGVEDNPKDQLSKNAGFLNTTLSQLLEKNGIKPEDLWEDTAEDYIWFAKLYPACDTPEEAIQMGQLLVRMAKGEAAPEEVQAFLNCPRESLYSSFNQADVAADVAAEQTLERIILVKQFEKCLMDGVYYKDALLVFGKKIMDQEMFQLLMEDAKNAMASGEQFSLGIRIYYALVGYMKNHHISFQGITYDELENRCFQGITDVIYQDAVKHLPDISNKTICKDQVEVQLPVRVNWGGGWTDTPPYCNEKGGIVLNAAVKINGIYPVQVCVRRLPEYHVAFESQDLGVYGTISTVEELQDCHNPYDVFALHKAALIACGIIPLEAKEDLETILKRLGGGIYLSTQVIGIPKGSGLGTSSILSAACVQGIFQFLGQDLDYHEVSQIVLGMEQIMSTGGGWQDQIGGLTEGIKVTSSEPGIHQALHIRQLELSQEAKQELQERFALIYTGQRRLARNLLRDVVGNYIGARPASVSSLTEMKKVTEEMCEALETGNIDRLAELFNRHWELSKQLDSGCTNTCIDQIFLSCEDLICGKFISGAGGGGFLQVILRKGVTKEALRKRILEIFQDSGVDVWDCLIV